jgi:2-hydroxycyclohexanecarboxyl-CoA dehydrogenase
VDATMDAVAAREGGLHVLVNCAGWDKPMPFVDTTPEFWDKILAINLKGPLACTRAALRHMITQQSGKIITIASDAGRVGSTGEAVYSAAKGGVVAFSKSLARELSRAGVTVNVVSPGPTDTPMLDAIRATDFGGKVVDRIVAASPRRRLALPDEIAGAVSYFVSDGATFVTGQVLSVSGGLTMAG